jgi:hypothetical protein
VCVLWYSFASPFDPGTILFVLKHRAETVDTQAASVSLNMLTNNIDSSREKHIAQYLFEAIILSTNIHRLGAALVLCREVIGPDCANHTEHKYAVWLNSIFKYYSRQYVFEMVNTWFLLNATWRRNLSPC